MREIRNEALALPPPSFPLSRRAALRKTIGRCPEYRTQRFAQTRLRRDGGEGGFPRTEDFLISVREGDANREYL